MADAPLTLRVIPRMFQSVLGDSISLMPSRSPREPVTPTTSDPLAFVPLSVPVTATIGSAPLPGEVERTATPPRRLPRLAKPAAGSRAVALSHSAERVAHAIVQATDSPADPRTLNAWGQHVGVSRGALRVWCTAAGVSARSCLDFLRVLRAVLVSEREDWDLLDVLDVVDQRTLVQLLDRGGIRDMRRRRPSVRDFLARQRFIDDERLISAVKRQLKRPF